MNATGHSWNCELHSIIKARYSSNKSKLVWRQILKVTTESHSKHIQGVGLWGCALRSAVEARPAINKMEIMAAISWGIVSCRLLGVHIKLLLIESPTVLCEVNEVVGKVKKSIITDDCFYFCCLYVQKGCPNKR